MRHAVFQFQLRGGHFEIAPEFQLAINDVVNGIGAPGQGVMGAAARAAAATPFIGKEHLGAVIVESGRMPVGKALVGDGVNTRRLSWVGNIENDAVARARAGGDPGLGKHRDVVALVRLAGFLGFIAVVPAPPQARQRAGFGVCEHRGAVNDARLVGGIGRDFDHVDTKQRGARVARQVIEAARHFFLLSDAGGSGVIHDDVAVLVRARDHRVGVGTPAGLNGAYLNRAGQVADVENAQAPESLRADILADAAQPAIEPPPGLLCRHEQQVADDGHVTLSARADDRRHELRALPGQLIDVEAVVAARDQHVIAESHVGIDEAEHGIAASGAGFDGLRCFLFGFGGVCLILVVLLLVVFLPDGLFQGVCRVEKAGWTGQ